MPKIDWRAVANTLDRRGYARVPGLVTARDCCALRDLYSERARFRSFVDLGAKGYGDQGDYRYFAYPLPAVVSRLRSQLYRPLARMANRWAEDLGRPERFPSSLRTYLKSCHAASQTQPTPLLLRYQEGGYNCLHQDLYGQLAFPFQVAVLISNPESDFTGGEFLLTEQKPRAQARGEAVALRLGEAIIFPNRFRPVEGKRGTVPCTVRHGVSRVTSGERMALGLIFHDAE
ncbi:MAG: proline hydroxylase [bacterium TMED88]|nr:proline hydroxylase [Deltaproteobacteria bacterium]OUV23499.1 MAG: proline hydroxylase [bacterium TMED88]